MSDEDELEVLRTKLFLLDAQTWETPSFKYDLRTWAITWAGSKYFRFLYPHARFYPTEREAIEEALRLILTGEGEDQLEQR